MLVELRLQGRSVLIVGHTSLTIDKAYQYVDDGAHVSVVWDGAPPSQQIETERLNTLDPLLVSLTHDPAYDADSESLAPYWLVVATDRNAALNERLVEHAGRGGFLLSTLDTPQSCDFYNTAIAEPIPGVKIGVSTSGASPAFASFLKRRIESLIGTDEARVFEVFKTRRAELKASGISTWSVDWSALAVRTLNTPEIQDRPAGSVAL